MTKTLDELGYYLLAGAGGEGPATLMDEARRGEELGFGTAFISERWNVKEASSLVGAACAVTSRMQIATAATNHNTRHPLITGSWATTMHRLSGGRFTLGVGRGIAAIYGAFGIPAVTTAQMEDWAQVMRRLWHGEVIFNHDGPMGKYPILFLDPDFNEDIRLALVAFGPNTLALGGRVFDDVILHTYFTPETLQRCVTTVKSAAEKAGRDPDSVRVWSCFATVGDHLPEQLRLKKTVARLATYLQGYGDLLVQTNNWDPAVLQRFRADSVVTSIAGGIDHKATPEQIEHIATLIPDEWLEPSATGSAQRVRGPDPQGIRLRGRRGDHAWRDARRTRADRRGVPSDLIGKGMSQYLKDKVIIVTGAASGFGKLISEKCAAGGAKVVGVDVSVDALNEVFEGIRAAGFDGTTHVADVTDMAQVQAAGQHAVDTYGRIDVIVNNAGVMPLAFFADHERAWEKWHKAIDINIKGVVNGISAVYDTMIKQGRGQVVNISSIYGNAGTEGSGVYSATKAAVDVLSDSLRVEAQGRIKVTTVKPTGVLGTNLAGGVVNEAAVIGIVGQKGAQFLENAGNLQTGALRPEQMDVDSVEYWLITPDDLANAVVHVIDQPWGINISDVTVRASGENYVC